MDAASFCLLSLTRPLFHQIEESYIGAEDFCRQANVDPKFVLSNEIVLLQVRVFTPPRCGGYRAWNLVHD